MRNEEYNEFDQLYRSMLEDAEVKAPRGAWRAVSARLPRANASAAPSFGWVKWAGASLAFAAALAAGLFFTGTIGNRTSVQENSVAILTDIDNSNHQLTPQAPSVEDEPDVVEHQNVWNGSMPAKTPVLSDRTLDLLNGKALESSEDQPAIGPKEPAPGTDETSEGKASTAKDRKWKKTEPMTEAEAWAALELEESRSKFKPHAALALEGTLGGNDSDILARASRSGHMSFGNSTAKQTGIDETSASSYGIPFSVGIGARIYFAPRFSVGTGIDYTLLSRNFSGTYTQVDGGVVTKTLNGDVDHRMQYLGIPVNFYYDILSGGKAKFYVYAGGEAEYCVSNKYNFTSGSENITLSNPVKGLQFSAQAGLGVEFKLSKTIGLYLDPSLNYYFHCDQPKSVRTEKPLTIDFEAGLRFDLGNGR